MSEIDRNEDSQERHQNDNWQFVGKLVNLTPFDDGEKLQTLVETDTTFFVILDTITEPVRKEVAVKISKKDNAVKIGRFTFERP